nr:TPA_asm: polymerase [Datura ophiovirus]
MRIKLNLHFQLIQFHKIALMKITPYFSNDHKNMTAPKMIWADIEESLLQDKYYVDRWISMKSISDKTTSTEKSVLELFNKMKQYRMEDSHLYKIFVENFDELFQMLESRATEKKEEPDLTDVGFEQKFNHLVEWIPSQREKDYVDKPTLISKICSPYRSFSERNLQLFVSSKLYPEKFNTKNKIDLMQFRRFVSEFGEDAKRIMSSQDSIIEFYLKMREVAHASPHYTTFINFASNLENYEASKMRNMMTGDRTTGNYPFKNNFKVEPKMNTLKSSWILSVLETINLKIKISYSKLNKKKDSSISVNFHENRRINTTSNKDGSSVTKLEIRSHKDVGKETQIEEIYIFVSSTITSIIYDKQILVGDGNMLNYLLTVAENSNTLDWISELNYDLEQNEREREQDFIMYVKSLLELKNPKRTNMTAFYETTCLLMADYKMNSSILPLLDNLYDSTLESPYKTKKLVEICMMSEPQMCIKMSSICKTIVYAEVDENKGLSKYTQRTNRNHDVDPYLVEHLRDMFKMKVITTYIKKYGIVPKLLCCPDDLVQELSLMAAGGGYSKEITFNENNYRGVRLGKMLELGQETNIISRIIDKACTKDEYDSSGNSVKELIYFIKNNNLTELVRNVKIENSTTAQRLTKIVDRKDQSLTKMKKYTIVRLVEKEKELKTAARFYGVASFKIKLYISTIMELVKRAMKLIPGQMMTMTEDQRRNVMYEMSMMLEEKDSYSIFLDYSGHNTSQRPENNLFILEEICDMYGFEGEERRHVTQVLDIFNTMEVIFENLYSDNVYYSKHQKGAIEGWLGPLWGIQSQLMMEDMLRDLKFSSFKCTTYSDDSCGVFIEESMTQEKLNDIILHLKTYSRRMGLLVKLSQTQVTNGRCSMLKNHYFKDTPIENNYKRMMGISPNSSYIWGDELEQIKIIDSGYTSSCARSSHHKVQTILRNYKFTMLLKKEIMRFVDFFGLEKDPRQKLLESAIKQSAKLELDSLKEAINILQESEGLTCKEVPDEEDVINGFYLFHKDDIKVLSNTLILMYAPYAMFGFACTPIIDASLSGYSISSVKRIAFIDSIIANPMDKVRFYSLIRLSTNAYQYITDPLPLSGGRFDTGTLLKDFLKKNLEQKIENEELLAIFEATKQIDEEKYKAELVTSFKKSFSYRIVGKFYESSIFCFFENIYSKIDNSTTFSFVLGKYKMNKLWNQAWTKNHMINYEYQTNINWGSPRSLGYKSLIEARNNLRKTYKLGAEEKELIIDFLDIEEIPILGKLEVDEVNGQLRAISRTSNNNRGKNKSPPIKTYINSAKFDRDLEIEGMFQNKLIFMAYELVRYTKWIMMELEKYSELSNNTADSLKAICDLTLSTFSDAKFNDLTEHVVSPRGGRYFHRAKSSGFRERTGDLSSNEGTNLVEVAGIDKLIDLTGGEDNNINIQYLILVIKSIVSYCNIKNHESKLVTICSDIWPFIKEVSFNLKLKPAELIINFYNKGEKINNLHKIKSKSKIYKNLSYFLSTGEELEGHFINNADAVPHELMMRQNSFRSVHKYMIDQCIISPELIPMDILEKIAPEIRDFTNKDHYFDEFYKFYTSLNIIENETPTRSVIRSLLYDELFKRTKSTGKVWSSEIIRQGYSLEYREILMRLFIVATSLSYRLTHIKGCSFILQINEEKTVSNSITNLKRIKADKAHLHIRDKRISKMLLMALPSAGFTVPELITCAKSIHQELNGKEFRQYQLNNYYSEEIKSYVKADFDHEVGVVYYSSLPFRKEEFEDTKMLKSAVKSFEMICSMNCKPKNVSSPTLSDVYPSMISLLALLKSSGFIKENDKVIDLFAGRGDSHLALNELKIQHRSVSRNDGFNLINRIRGMTEVKAKVDVTEKSFYSKYLDHDVYLLDISHYSSTKENLMKMINDLIVFERKIILRLNSIMKYLGEEFINIVKDKEMRIVMPSIESPGYIYLTINGKEEIKELDQEKIKRKSFKDSIISEIMTKGIMELKDTSLFNKGIERVKDHTEEAISDERLSEMLIEHCPDFVEVPKSLDKIMEDENGLEELLIVPCSLLSNNIEKEDFYRVKLKTWKPRIIYSGSCEENPEKEILVKSKRGDEEIVLPHYLQFFGNTEFLTGFENLEEHEFFRLVEAIANSRIKESSRMAWKFIYEASVRSNTVFNSDTIIKSFNISKMKLDGTDNMTRIYRIANLAVRAYKSGRILDGLKETSGIKKLNLNELVKNKSKNKRYDCLNYKLIINRLRRIHHDMALSVTCNKSLTDSNTFEWNSNTIEELELKRFIESFKSVSEFFEKSSKNELFDVLVSSVKNNKEEESFSEKIEDKSSLLTELTQSLIGTTVEEYEINRNMTLEEMIKISKTSDEFEEDDDYCYD